MPKNRKSNKELKKQPAMTMKEKRAAKKAKSSEKVFLVPDSAKGGPAASGTKRS